MKQKLKALVEAIARKNHRFASLYYAFFSKAMSHEHFTVLNGKYKFQLDASTVKLRRNTHRLEKGLIMVPRKDVFAKDYILETVQAFCAEKASSGNDMSSLTWSQDVLNRYFAAVEHDEPEIIEAYKKFNASKSLCDGSYEKSPYLRGSETSPVSYERLYDLSVLRRSVRWYQQKKVPRELVDKAIELAKLSPSACNRQPFRLRVYDDKHKVEQVASLPGGTKGFSHNFPMVIAVCGQLRNYYSEADRHIIFIDASLFSMSFTLALETLGLSSCIINWPENLQTELKAREQLDLDDDERIIFLISVGFADQDRLIPYSQKKSLEEIRVYNP